MASTKEYTFFAREDGSSANNSSLNVDPGSAFEITFISDSSAPDGGDVILDYGPGGDPNTLVRIDGVEYDFTVEFSAVVSATKKAANNGIAGLKATVITVDRGGPNEMRLVFLPDANLSLGQMNAISNGAYPTGPEDPSNPVIVCFRSGTTILTPKGKVRIEDLEAGDAVVLLDGGPRPILWHGRQRVSTLQLIQAPALRPVRIPRDAFAPGMPDETLYLTRHHRVPISSPDMHILFGFDEAFIPAHFLLRTGLAEVEPGLDAIDYHHLLFDRHDILWANGIRAESLYVGKRVSEDVDIATRAEVEAIFPNAGFPDATRTRHMLARPQLKPFEFDALLRYSPDALRRCLAGAVPA